MWGLSKSFLVDLLYLNYRFLVFVELKRFNFWIDSLILAVFHDSIFVFLVSVVFSFVVKQWNFVKLKSVEL